MVAAAELEHGGPDRRVPQLLPLVDPLTRPLARDHPAVEKETGRHNLTPHRGPAHASQPRLKDWFAELARNFACDCGPSDWPKPFIPCMIGRGGDVLERTKWWLADDTGDQ